MKLTHIGNLKQEPKIGEEITFLFNKWEDKQAYLLNKDGKIWLSLETGRNEKLTILRELMKSWLE